VTGDMNTHYPTQKEEALAGLAHGDRTLFLALTELARTSKQDPDPAVAAAARRWERTLWFKLRLDQQRRRRTPCLAGRPASQARPGRPRVAEA